MSFIILLAILFLGLIVIGFPLYMLRNAERQFSSFPYWLIGWKHDSLIDSNVRRMLSRFSLFISLIVLYSASLEKIYPREMNINAQTKFIFAAYPLMSIWFFFSVVLITPFKQADSFEVDIPRLLFDSVVSMFFMITTFAVMYMFHGICSNDECTSGEQLNSLYFSAVTFSTLGFGDFSPTPASRLYASVQAILGNLHLGMIAGTTFAALARQRKAQ